MTEAGPPDPSRSSYYVGNDFYDSLAAAFARWPADDREIADAADRDEFRRLLEREARILDERRFEDWLALFAPECAYWIPGTPGGGDPRREIAIAFDDRRRLEDRIFRLRSKSAWSQAPESRTMRAVSNVQAWRADRAAAMVRANFAVTEFRDGETRTWAGWAGYRMRRGLAGWEILAKQVNLLDCDRNLRNPSILL